ncbi:MAG: hypothetical protein ACC628_07220 [Pirellulaceae bacterium]
MFRKYVECQSHDIRAGCDPCRLVDDRSAWRDTPRTRGMYRYDGDGNWTSCGCPGLRVVHLSVHNGNLFGLSYDGGGFFRYDGGTNWTRLGPVPDTTQLYDGSASGHDSVAN